MDVRNFDRLPLMGIVRGIDIADIDALIESVIQAELGTIEITMNTPHAPEVISRAKKVSKGRVDIGAGTVLSVDDAKKAVNAGATFIVMPACIKEVIVFCRKKRIPVFPGALTPHEVLNAWQEGATMVKVFPAGFFGPGYIKELKGPFEKIKLMAVGGVRPENVKDYFSSGADAVAFGASVFRKEWIKEKDFASITELVRRYVQTVRTSTTSYSR